MDKEKLLHRMLEVEIQAPRKPSTLKKALESVWIKKTLKSLSDISNQYPETKAEHNQERVAAFEAYLLKAGNSLRTLRLAIPQVRAQKSQSL